MSTEQASEFIKKLSTDEAMAEKVRKTYRAALVQAGKDAGFKFTKEDLDAALVEMKSEVAEGAMAGVAGGIVLRLPPRFPRTE